MGMEAKLHTFPDLAADEVNGSFALQSPLPLFSLNKRLP
jgi:hypothetical protein